MAEEKETVILDFQIQSGDAIQELERTKKSIISLKEEQSALSKAYKSGAITLDEYASETVRVEAVLKKQTNTYSTLQKQVTGIKTPFDKLTDSMKQQAEQTKIGGISIGEMGSKITALANPVTAAVGLFGALAAVYQRSTIGAKDLEFAHNELATSLTIVSNKFASLFSSAEDGDGIISNLVNRIIFQFSPALAATVKVAALNMEKLEDLQRERLKIEQNANELLDENATIMERIADSNISNNEKLQLTNKAVHNLRDIEAERVKNSEAQLEILNTQLSLDKNNEELQTRVLEKELEISKIKKDIEKRVSSIEKAESNIEDARNKELQSTIAIGEAKERTQTADQKLKTTSIQLIPVLDAQVQLTSQLESVQDRATKSTDKLEKSQKSFYRTLLNTANATKENTTSWLVASNAAGTFANTFAQNTVAYKALASAQAAINTYLAATQVLAEPDLLFPLDLIAAGVVTAAGLASVAKINGIGFSEGGYTGPGGKYQPAGIVHAGEVVWNQSDVAAVGGPAMANRMRPTYSDGGIVAQGMTAKASAPSGVQSVEVALVYREFKEFMTAVKYKEQLTTA